MPVRASIDGVSADAWNHNIHYYPMVLRAVPDRAERALDVGCGEGVLAQRLGTLVSHAVGIDKDEDSVTRARTQFVGVEYVLGDFMTYPFEQASFDFIASVASLHHMDEEAALRRMRALLRPGGRLFVIGLARSSRPVDGVVDIAGMVANRVHKRFKAEVEDCSPKLWPAPHTYRQTRRLALRTLPGARFRRHLLWRYSLVWTNPAATS
ncbi:MAG: class I SAM-dependent methyltransferase [Actinomycetota bacterium]|nr:class I SAM-dependent methyltransferase [Actinomycetota bacterium]